MNKPRVLMIVFVRNESRYLKEWIDWNVYAGATRFVVYDNNLDNPEEEARTRAVLQPYVEVGLLFYHRWHHMEGRGSFFGLPVHYTGKSDNIKNKKHYAIDHALHRHEGRSYDLVLKIDPDEFVMPVDGGPLKHVWHRLIDYMKRQRSKGVRIDNWFFGTSGHKEPPANTYSVVDTYVRRETSPSNFKGAARGKWIKDCGPSSHWWNYKWSATEITVLTLILTGSVGLLLWWSLAGPGHWAVKLVVWAVWVVLVVVCTTLYHMNQNQGGRVDSQPIVRLHHYYTKSEAEFMKRRKHQASETQTNSDEVVRKRFMKKQARYNVVEDRLGQEMVKEFRKEMGETATAIAARAPRSGDRVPA